METQFEDSLDSVFDVRSVRVALEERRSASSSPSWSRWSASKRSSRPSTISSSCGRRAPPATAAAVVAPPRGDRRLHTAAEREIDATAVAMRASQEMAAEIKRANAEFAHHSPAKSKSHASFGRPPGSCGAARRAQLLTFNEGG